MTFQVGDRVRKRYTFGDGKEEYLPEGTVVAINGRWVHVKHDMRPNTKAKAAHAQPPRFDYLADELEHINPVLRFVDEV